MLGEVRLRRGLDAVGVVPEVDLVQVAREDPVLRVHVLELLGEAGLLDLAVEGDLLADVEVADELLRDRRAALDDVAALHVLDGSADDALPVDTAVLVEAAVLDVDSRARDPVRHAVETDRLAVPLRGDRAEHGSVGRVDEGVRADRDGLQRVQVAVVQDSGRAGHRRSHEGRDGSEDDDEREEDGEAPRRDLFALPPLPPPAAPVRRVERPVPVPLAVPVRRHQA